MATKKSGTKPYILHHKDGSVWARGQKVDGLASGYWEWTIKLKAKEEVNCGTPARNTCLPRSHR